MAGRCAFSLADLHGPTELGQHLNGLGHLDQAVMARAAGENGPHV